MNSLANQAPAAEPAVKPQTSLYDEVYPPELRKAEAEQIVARRKQNDIDPPDAPRVGMALSGGGIRSATFCLGVFQALAREKLIGCPARFLPIKRCLGNRIPLAWVALALWIIHRTGRGLSCSCARSNQSRRLIRAFVSSADQRIVAGNCPSNSIESIISAHWTTLLWRRKRGPGAVLCIRCFVMRAVAARNLQSPSDGASRS